MTAPADDSSLGSAAFPGMARWPTGAKLLVILSVALLPLALIAVFATLKTIRIADTEARTGLRIATAESSRAIGIELVGDMTALRAAVDALERDPADAPSCARVQGVFAQQAAMGVHFSILDAAGRTICGTPFPEAHVIAGAARAAPGFTGRIVPGRGIVLGIGGTTGRLGGAAFFPASFLAQIGRPSSFTPAYAATLVRDGAALPLQQLDRESALERRETSRVALGIAQFALELQVRIAPISSPLVIALLLPLLMWAAAAGISWFVVDRLLVRPLRQLRAGVAAFTPGELPDTSAIRSLPAQEIRELGDTFRALTRTVAIHEAGLAEGLVRQTKLTREVHHRVKNNLQVISSLINFHARGAESAEAAQAYASIQRRVDALAVVHRNHFAEMEENRGVGLRSVIGELASNIRATAPEGSKLGIVLDVDPFCVNQDVAVAVAFLVTETIELALLCDPAARVQVSLKARSDGEGQAMLQVRADALRDGETLREGLEKRYGRVMQGLARQLRAPLAYDGEAGSYAIAIATVGRE